MPIRVIVGIDPSLSATGVAAIVEGGERPQFTVVNEGPSRKVPKGATPLSAEEEADHIRRSASRTYLRVSTILQEVRDANPDAELDVWFAVEGPAYGAQNGKADERAGLRWTLILAFARNGRVLVIPPTTAKKYWTGNGNADKAKMMSFTRLRYRSWGMLDHNANDALVMAAIAADHRGFPLEPAAPQVDRSALTGVQWPEPLGEKTA